MRTRNSLVGSGLRWRGGWPATLLVLWTASASAQARPNPPAVAPPAPAAAPPAAAAAPATANPAPAGTKAAGGRTVGDTQGLQQFETGVEYEPRSGADRVSFSLEDADLSELVRVI